MGNIRSISMEDSVQVQSLGPLGPGLPESHWGFDEKMPHCITIYHTYITHIPTCFPSFHVLESWPMFSTFSPKAQSHLVIWLCHLETHRNTSSEHDGFWGLDYAPHSFVEPLVRGLKLQTLEWTHGQRWSVGTDWSTGTGKHFLYIRNLWFSVHAKHVTNKHVKHHVYKTSCKKHLAIPYQRCPASVHQHLHAMRPVSVHCHAHAESRRFNLLLAEEANVADVACCLRDRRDLIKMTLWLIDIWAIYEP